MNNLTPCSSTDTFLRILDRGIAPRRQRRRSVAIVGAGMAGLVSGWLLARAGFPIRIYEASHRVGGRVRTLRDGFSTGLYAEAGAMRIPENHRLTRFLCRHFGLRLVPFADDQVNTLVYLNRVRSFMRDYRGRRANFRRPYRPRCDGEKLLQSAVAYALPTYRNEDRRTELDRLSLGEYLRRFSKVGEPPLEGARPVQREDRLTDPDIDLIGLDCGFTELRCSLIEALREQEAIGSPGKSQVWGGMDRLPRSFVRAHAGLQKTRDVDLTDSLRFSARVVQVSRKAGAGFRITYEHPRTRSHNTKDADFVILAAPFSALSHVRLRPAVSAPKMKAIRSLHYENATKIILEFGERFWEKYYGIHGGRSFTDLPVRWIYYPAPAQNPSHSKRGLLLASYTIGEDSARWTSLTPDERIRYALRDIAHIHNRKSSDYYNQFFVNGMSHSWADDEFTLGAFALFAPHQETELFDTIWRPENGIHFAGEHTSLKHAWIEGAVESGIRAAVEVFRAASGRATH